MPIYQTASVGPPQIGGQTKKDGSKLGKDEFLKLLTNQLRYQDPTNPMKGAEFASQLAQFSSVEQLTNISGSLEQSIEANYVLTQAINNGLSAGFVGKEVRATGDSFNLSQASDDTSRNVKLGYTLDKAASSVVVKIKNAQGAVVRTMNSTGTNMGENSFTWDGTDGNTPPVDLPAGKYTFSVEAKDSESKSIASSTYFFGKISAVKFTTEGTKFVINGQEVSLGSILEVLGG
jgi:flagellar basal-body rod modification protein FlgD